MNILVTGGNGQLGNAMRDIASLSTDRYIFSDISTSERGETLRLDITSREEVHAAVEKYSIECIVNCAAYTNVEGAEDNAPAAELLNATAPGILAGEMALRGGLLIHVSTDYVFGKEPYNTPCREDQKGTPTGVYGETKLHGEQRIISSGCRYIILRTAWLYSEYGKNFVRTMLSLTKTRPELNVVFDQTGTPTYAGDLAAAIMDIIQNRKAEGNEGIYHFSNEGVCSWYDFTKAISAMSGHTACNIRPCHSSEYPSRVVRPAYSVLDKSKYKATFGREIPYWTESLEKCIANLTK